MRTLSLILLVLVLFMSVSCESRSARVARSTSSVTQSEKVVVLNIVPFNEVVDKYKVLRLKDRTVAFIKIPTGTRYSISDTIRTSFVN